MENKNLLIVEDDKRLKEALSLEFEDKGYSVFTAEAKSSIPQKINFNYAIVDLRLNGTSGLEVVEYIKDHSKNCNIVVLTGYGSISSAVEAMKLGAINYLTKPADIDKIEKALLGESVEPENTEKPISLSRQEHEYIEYVLNQNGGNITKTAKALGLHRQSLQRKLKKRPL